MAEKKQGKKIAVILLRGLIGMNTDIRDTLRMLNLQKKLSLAIVEDNPVTKGMLQKCKDYITYGEISEETLKELNEKRPTENKFYSMHPPKGGFERKGIKKSFSEKGALGYRGEKINDLIKKMM